MRRVLAWTCGDFGNRTLRTPFFKLASTLSSSISAGSGTARRNEPKLRSLR